VHNSGAATIELKSTFFGAFMNIAAATAMRLGAPGAILLALGFASSAHAEEYLKSYSVTGRPDVHVHVDDSSVHILTSDTHQIEFRVSSEGSATLNIGAKLRIDSQQNGNQVELTVITKPGTVVNVVMPELVVRGWARLLHNQRALYIKRLLLFERHVILSSVPYQFFR